MKGKTWRDGRQAWSQRSQSRLPLSSFSHQRTQWGNSCRAEPGLKAIARTPPSCTKNCLRAMYRRAGLSSSRHSLSQIRPYIWSPRSELQDQLPPLCWSCCVLAGVLALVLSVWQKQSKVIWEEELWLGKYFHKTGLSARLWGHFLHWWLLVKGSAHCGQCHPRASGPGYIKKYNEQARRHKPESCILL